MVLNHTVLGYMAATVRNESAVDFGDEVGGCLTSVSLVLFY